MLADQAKARQEAIEQLQRLREDYLRRLPEELVSLVSMAQKIASSPSHRGLDILYLGLHALAGSGGIFGLLGLSFQARALEVRIKALMDLPAEQLKQFSWDGLARDVAMLKEYMTETSLVDKKTDQAMTHPFSANSERAQKQGKILVWLVEEDLLQGEELSRQLMAFGYESRWFTGLDDAEIAARTDHPDILLLDVLYEQGRVNATEKLESCTALRALGCPMVFVTSHDDFDSRVRATRLGALGYCLKPLNIPRLINRLSQILECRYGSAERVLIVDDDPVQSEHYRLVLAASGMSVKTLNEPQDIIEAVSSTQPELVLLDVNMPGYSGPDLAGVLRQYERWVSLPIVYLSAVTDLGMQIQALERGGDDFIAKPVSDAQLVAAVRNRIARLRTVDFQVSRDGLTGLLRHSAIKDATEIEVTRARRSGKPMSVAMVDIDHFKSVNDNHGHAVGDLVISTVALLLRQHVRASDVVGRYGGEEFAVVLPECNAEDARRLIDGIRLRFSQVSFGNKGSRFSCTFSAGVVSSDEFGSGSGEGLLVAADEALYQAKNAGRNQVVVGHPVGAAASSLSDGSPD